MSKTIVIGACGQIGTELVLALRQRHGNQNVWAADVKESCPEILREGPYLSLDVLNREEVRRVIIENELTTVYLLAALLSATAEKNPDFAWRLNMEGLFTILDLGKEGVVQRILWPSSIAVFGPSTPKKNTPQHTVMEPSTVYGISKQAGEQWCAYYFNKFGVDVRSLRYPGLISHKSLPGGGTTDYAVDIFYQAKKTGKYSCFLRSDTALPMMFMEDAIEATLQLMEASAENLSIRTSYNVSACSFTPSELAERIKREIPAFEVSYSPDFRQGIADSWPASIDDQVARKDWGWNHRFGLDELVSVMLEHVDPTKI
jgi:nucleoside-diphosphate-sugar epimerase